MPRLFSRRGIFVWQSRFSNATKSESFDLVAQGPETPTQTVTIPHLPVLAPLQKPVVSVQKIAAVRLFLRTSRLPQPR
jgi:hypothetical protein